MSVSRELVLGYSLHSPVPKFGVGKIALGGIRHPEVQQFFEKYQISYMRRHDMIQLMTAFSKTRSREWLSLYESKKQTEKAPSVLQAIEYAERNVHPPFDFE